MVAAAVAGAAGANESSPDDDEDVIGEDAPGGAAEQGAAWGGGDGARLDLGGHVDQCSVIGLRAEELLHDGDGFLFGPGLVGVLAGEGEVLAHELAAGFGVDGFG